MAFFKWTAYVAVGLACAWNSSPDWLLVTTQLQHHSKMGNLCCCMVTRTVSPRNDRWHLKLARECLMPQDREVADVGTLSRWEALSYKLPQLWKAIDSFCPIAGILDPRILWLDFWLTVPCFPHLFFPCLVSPSPVSTNTHFLVSIKHKTHFEAFQLRALHLRLCKCTGFGAYVYFLFQNSNNAPSSYSINFPSLT